MAFASGTAYVVLNISPIIWIPFYTFFIVVIAFSGQLGDKLWEWRFTRAHKRANKK